MISSGHGALIERAYRLEIHVGMVTLRDQLKEMSSCLFLIKRVCYS